MIRQLAKRLFPTRKKKQGVPLELIEQITLGDPFASLLRSMYSGEAQLGTDGAKHSLHPTTLLPPAGGMLLYRLFREIKPAASLEIGLAYGYSTIYILAALKANGSGHHLAIDPFQESSWCGIGITRQEVLGLRDIFEFSPDTSARALVQFAKEGRLFDAIFIDGDHKFDSVLIDFSLSASICAPGGHIILDDMWMPSVKCAASFVRSNRKDFSELRSSVPSMAIFKKTGTDNRAWDDFAPFANR